MRSGEHVPPNDTGGGKNGGVGEQTEREQQWAATMEGFAQARTSGHDLVTAHADSLSTIDTSSFIDGIDRSRREEREDRALVAGATRAVGAGQRLLPEEPDPWRTCFERDRDRILHA